LAIDAGLPQHPVQVLAGLHFFCPCKANKSHLIFSVSAYPVNIF